ncbi:hypothetical protein PsorP6_000919 [Peronosclerospora sorghi]|uniref:Uncharacterized protein n=1 Tax=Peronosclerospora sorghi TaxID=230839 RepID=A0ACC0WWM0_9STRA|nr:hypothetical protein PsorP6_000919 [Peronosclerospora sorghi]
MGLLDVWNSSFLGHSSRAPRWPPLRPVSIQGIAAERGLILVQLTGIVLKLHNSLMRLKDQADQGAGVQSTVPAESTKNPS